jgi:pyridoxine kinase
VLADRKEAWLAAHAKVERSPNGTGDLLTALYAASILEGQTLSYGLARAVGGVAETVTAANIWNAPELPIVAMGARIKQTSPTVASSAWPSLQAGTGCEPVAVPGAMTV